MNMNAAIFLELWDYFQSTKAYENCLSSRSGLVLFKKDYRGSWYHLVLLTARRLSNYADSAQYQYG